MEFGSRGVVVTTTQQGHATPVFTYLDSNNATQTGTGSQVAFGVDGTVTAQGGQMTYTYSGGY